MKWNELKKIATENGFKFYKSLKGHDLYINEKKQARSSCWSDMAPKRSGKD